MNKQKKFSVIIPERNWNTFVNGEDMKWMFFSLFKTANRKFIDEIIIIDDYSNKKNFESIKKFCEKYPNVILKKMAFGNINGGNRSLTRNFGAFIAKNDYLVFLDQDTIPSDNYFESLLIYINKIGDDISYNGTRLELINNDFSFDYIKGLSLPDRFKICKCDFIHEHPCHNILFTKQGWNSYQLVDSIKKKSKLFLSGFSIHENPVMFKSNNFFITKTNFEKIGGFDCRYYGWGEEDPDFAWTLYKNNIKILHIDRFLITAHYPHPFNGNLRVDEWIRNFFILSDKYPEFAKIRKKNVLNDIMFITQINYKNIIKKIENFYNKIIYSFGLAKRKFEVKNNSWEYVLELCKELNFYGIYPHPDIIYKFIIRRYGKPEDIDSIKKWNTNIS